MTYNRFWSALKGANQVDAYPWARNRYFVGDLMPPQVGYQQVGSIEEALGRMIQNDILFLGPQGFDEGNLVVDTPGITIIGAGNRGACFIEPSASADEGLQIAADDVTLINVGVACGATGTYALNVHAASRTRIYGCKIEGAEAADAAGLLLDGTDDGQASDFIANDCEFAWNINAILGDNSSYGYPTQIRIQNCLLHNYTTVGIGVLADGLFKDLWLIDNVFGRQEDGTAGTDDILLSDNGNTGFITGNRFPRATNGTGFITIGSGLIYNPNGTEAGWSTARPA